MSTSSDSLAGRVGGLFPASTVITALTTVIVGFVSTIPIVTDAARALAWR